MSGGGSDFPRAGVRLRTLCAVLGYALGASAHATNGVNVIGFGFESGGMGGADIAVARDANGLNINPAGLTQIHASSFEFVFGAAFADDVGHQDQMGNDLDVDQRVIPAGTTSYARRINDSVVVGIGLFAQGGSGAVYESFNSPFGGRDRLEAKLGIARLSAGAGWQVGEHWSLGAALTLNYARLEQKIFPSASVFNPADPQASFFGSSTDDMSSTRVGYKLGAQYAPNDNLRFGLNYSAKRSLPFTGEMTFNLSSIGLGRVRYNDVELESIGLPEEVGLGMAWQATPKLLLAADVSWLRWSDVIKKQTLRARGPSNPAAPAVLELPDQNLDWHDQYVFALGAQYQWSDKLHLYAGFNYGANPIPARNSNPLLLIMGEKHLTAGVRYQLDGGWYVGAFAEYLMQIKVHYNNPQLPFGPSVDETGYLGVSIVVGGQW